MVDEIKIDGYQWRDMLDFFELVAKNQKKIISSLKSVNENCYWIAKKMEKIETP